MENQIKENKIRIRHFSSIFFVSNRDRTIGYYKNLGFSCDSQLGFIRLGGLELIVHETTNVNNITPNYPVHGENALNIFVMVYGVEELFEEFKSKGAKFHYELRTTEYNMKEFSLIDPDGYTIGFGESLND